MEYKSIAFDMNKPIAQQITEPLNSVYGVAVKVYKDGEYADADITVDGKTAEELVDGWKAVELSSGSVPATKALDVTAEKQASVSVKAEGSDTQSNTMPFPTNILFAVPLSNYITSDTEVTTESFKEFLTEPAVLPSEMWLGTKLVTATQYCWNPNDKHWHTKGRGYPRVDSFTLTPDMFICADLLVPASGSQTMKFKLDLDSGDSFTGKFSLVVQEQDLGYFEK